MQQRRMKRLAGPAFYVNVKFDQDMASTNKKNNRPRHVRYNNFHEWELFDIKEGEILVCKKSSNKTSDHFPRVISSLNGALDQGKDEETLLKDFTFFGIAQTEHVAEKNPQINQGLVATVGGLATIINDWDENISPGDLLYLHTPSTNPHKNPHRGIPLDKKRFCLKPNPIYDPNAELYDEFEKLANEVSKMQEDDDVIKALAEIVERRKHPVAKALSHARKGERLDILLHPRLPRFIDSKVKEKTETRSTETTMEMM